VIESRTARRERILGTCTAPFAERTAGGRAVKSASATVTDGSATSHADVHQGEDACIDEAASARAAAPSTLALDDQEARHAGRRKASPA